MDVNSVVSVYGNHLKTNFIQRFHWQVHSRRSFQLVHLSLEEHIFNCIYVSRGYSGYFCDPITFNKVLDN